MNTMHYSYNTESSKNPILVHTCDNEVVYNWDTNEWECECGYSPTQAELDAALLTI